jgi:hypothetical protein
MKKLWTVVGILVFCAGLGWGATYEWNGLGSNSYWTNTGNWDINGVPGSDGGTLPLLVSTDDVTFDATYTQWPTNVPTSLSINTLTIDDAALDLQTALDVTMLILTKGKVTLIGNSDAGAVVVGSAGTLDFGSKTLTVSGDFVSGGMISAAGSTLILNGPGNINLTVGGGDLGTVQITDGPRTALSAITTTGNLTVSATKTLALGANNLTVGGTITNYGTITLAGSQTVSPATIGGTGTVNFNAAGTTLAGITDFDGNLTINAGNRSVTNDINVDGNLTVNTSLTMTGNDLAVGGNIAVSASASLTAGNLNSGGHINVVSTGTLSVPGTLTLNGSIAQTINTSSTTVSALVVDKSGGTIATLGGTLTVNGGVTLTSGTLNGGSSATLNVGGTWDPGSGTWAPGTGTVVFNGASQTVNGNNTFNNVTMSGTTTINGANTFANLTISAGTVAFAAGLQQTIGSISATGTNTLTTNSAPTKWQLNLTGTFSGGPGTTIRYCESVNYLGLTDPTNATNGGNNIWVFSFPLYTWQGGTLGNLTDWAVHANWDVGQIPPNGATPAAAVTIPDTTNKPELSAAVDIGSLTLSAAASSLDMSGHGLIVTSLDNSGTVNLNGGNLTITTTTFTNTTGTIRSQGGETVTINGVTPSPSFTPPPGGTISYYGTVAALPPFGDSYTNLTIENQPGTNATYITSALTVSNTLTVNKELHAASIAVTGSASIGANVVTTGDQTYTGPVALTADAEFTAGSGQLVSFGSAVSGAAYSLTVTTANARFNGAVGGTGAANALSSVSVGGTSTVNANINTTGSQTYTGAVSLTNNVAFIAGTNTVTFGNTVDSDSAISRTLTVGDSSNTTNAVFGGIVGGAYALESIHVYGTSSVGANITTTGTTGQAYDGAVTLTANAAFLAGANTVTFGNTVNGNVGTALTVGNGSNVTNAVFKGPVGSSLVSVYVQGTSSVEANITTSGAQTYTGTVTLGGIGDTRTFTATGNGTITFNAATAITPNSKNLSVSTGAGGSVVFTGAVSSVGDGALATAITVSTDALTVGAAMSSTSNKDIILTADAYTLGASAAITAGTGTVYLRARTAANTIEFGPSQTNFSPGPSHWPSGPAGTWIDSDSFNSATNVAVGGASQTGGIFLTVASGSYNLSAQNTGGGFIEIRNYTSAAGTLTLTAGAGSGNIYFYGASPLTVSTGGGQTYTGASVLLQHASLTSSGLVWFNGTVNSDTTARSLEVTNNVRFDGVVGGASALSSVDIGGTSDIRTTGIATTGAQTYTGSVSLGADVTFTANTGNRVWFKNTVGWSGTARSLTVATANAQFDGAVGGASDATALSSVSVGGTSEVNTTGIRTTGNQTYTGAVSLGNNTSFIAGTATAEFSNGVNGHTSPRTLTVGDSTHATAANFGGVTGSANLASIYVYGATTVNSSATVTATGNQTYIGATTNNGTITAGPVAASSIAILFNGDYSGSGALVGNGTTSPNIFFGGSTTTIGNFTHNDDVVVFGTGVASIHAFTYTSTNPLANVTIAAGNTVTVTSGTVTQDPAGTGRTLTLNGTLDTSAGTWYIGPPSTLPSPSWYMLSDPSSSPTGDPNYENPGPAFSGGFAGFNGTLTMGNGSLLTTKDFYTQMTDVPTPTHTFTLNAPAAASTNCTISASGNVTINETFVNETHSTLTMTGNGGELAVRSHVVSTNRVPDVKLGNFVADGGTNATDATVINSVVVFTGENAVIIKSGKYLTTYPNAHIRLDPEAGLAKWTQEISPNGIFDLSNTPIVEFGRQGVTTGRTFEIRGNTTWHDLICREPGATLKFSNYPDTHSVEEEFLAMPLDASGNALEGGGGGCTNPYMIELTRLVGPLTHPTIPPFVPDTQPPSSISNDFWHFELKSGATLDLDYVYIQYSWAKNRIPLPRGGSKVILASPYVNMESGSPNYTLATPRGDDANFTDSAAKSYYSVNWLVANYFFYSFTEDTDGNGRIDRIRAQAGFDIWFDNVITPGVFRASVDGYTIDTSKGSVDYPGYEVGPLATNAADCLYIYLNEKDYSDTGARPSWRIEANTGLQDLATKSIYIGGPADAAMSAWDTAPPRINYALTIPEHDQIFVQFSEPVVIGDITGVSVDGPAAYVPPLQPIGGDSELIIPISPSPTYYSVGNLASATPPNFSLATVRDKAAYVSDIRSQPSSAGNRYPYLYPSPKYPTNWKYESYVEVRGNGLSVGLVIAPFDTVPPSGGSGLPHDIKDWSPQSDPADQKPGNLLNNKTLLPPYGGDTHRVTDALISVPPATAGDSQYFVWPVWAKYADSPNDSSFPADSSAMGSGGPQSTDTGIIWDFTGRKALEERDTTLQALRHSSLSSEIPELVYAFNVDRKYRNPPEFNTSALGSSGLWLPVTSPAADFINLVPQFYTLPYSYKTYDSTASTAPHHYIYQFGKDEPGYNSPARLDFLFKLPSSPADLFVARLDAGGGIPSDWYHRVRPFSYDIRDVTLQRGGVTILNNVINPNNGETVYLRYHLVNSGRVTVQVFTLDGTLIKTLRRENRSAGEWTESWNGTNNGGRPVARGMYFIRVVAPDIDEIRKVLVIK